MNNPKSVFVAIAGRPNAGKSTLTNYLVGEKIAIVSDKPQTTRTRINGVLTKGETQYVFIDTPGMHKAKNKLSDQMLKSIRESVTDVDVILMMADATKKISPIEHNLIDSFKDRKTDVVLLINQGRFSKGQVRASFSYKGIQRALRFQGDNSDKRKAEDRC